MPDKPPHGLDVHPLRRSGFDFALPANAVCTFVILLHALDLPHNWGILSFYAIELEVDCFNIFN
jgi:hypothetical protein